MMFQRLAVLAACLLSVPGTQADTTLTYDEGARQSLLRIADGKVRFDNGEDGRWFLFDAARRELTLVEPARRQYTVVDEPALDQLQVAMDAVTQLQEQLAQMPPALRQQMQQLAGGLLPRPPGDRVVRLEATGRHGEAAGYRCEYSRVMMNGVVESEICLAPAAMLDIAGSDGAVVKEWQRFAAAVAQRASRYVSVDARLLGSDGQVPLIYENPGSGLTGVLRDLSVSPIDAELMRVPADYRATRLDMRAF